MITFKIILGTVMFLGASIYMANSIPALIEAKYKEPNYYWNRYLLLFAGVMNFLVLIMFLMFMLSSIEQDSQPKEKPKYELIQEPVYRQVK
jgi:hypothetical protein